MSPNHPQISFVLPSIQGVQAAHMRLQQVAAEHPATYTLVQMIERIPDFAQQSVVFHWEHGRFRIDTSDWFESVMRAAEEHNVRRLFLLYEQALAAYRNDRRAAV